MASKFTKLARSFNPPDAKYKDGVLQWMDIGLREGLAVNRSQFNYDKIGITIDAIMGVDEPRILSPRLSNTRLNKMQKIALELRSMLTDIKPFWTYTTNSDRYERQADIFGKLAKNWYLRKGIDQVFRDTLDYVLAAGTGYVHLFWNPDLPGPTDKQGQIWEGDIDATSEDPRDVIPIRFNNGDKRTLQNCKGVIIRRERPTSWFAEMYGEDAVKGIEIDRIGLEKESPSQRRARDAEEAVLSTGGGTNNQGPLFGGAPAKHLMGPVPITDEFTAYLHDFSLNKFDKPIEMGPWTWTDEENESGERIKASPWSYKVQPGARLYPFLRRIVFHRNGIIEDGPGHFHHALLPVCKMSLDTWAWSFLGSTPMHTLLSLQRATDENVRSIQDHIRRLSKRGIIYDKKALPPALAKKLNTRLDGQKLGINPHAAGPKGAIQYVDEPPYDPLMFQWHTHILDMMDDLSGTAALRQLQGLNQMPSADTIDKIMDSMTPLVRARSRAMEVFIREFAMMLASMFMQFYPLELRLRILGADGMTFEDWDYRGGDLMPDYIADEDYELTPITSDDGSVIGHAHRIKASALKRGPQDDYLRNKEFLRYFEFDVAPGSLLDAANTTKRLFYLQGARMGLIDHWTLAEVWNIPNVGKPPAWATTITKRLQAERIMGVGIIASTAGRAPTAQSSPAFANSGSTIAES